MELSTHIYSVGSGLLLGLRHGVEWDHLAAIFDMTSTIQSSSSDSGRATIGENFSKSISLTGMYAIGHGFVVIGLGLLLKQMTNLFPVWLDQIMEKIVGGTLIVMGAWTIYAVWSNFASKKPRHLESRWSLIFYAINRFRLRLLRIKGSTSELDHVRAAGCTPCMALGIGMIHGIGVETSTQIILLSTASSLSHSIDCWLILLSFFGGLLFANFLVAVFYLAGSLTALSIRPLYLGLGLSTGIFSVGVGLLFVLNLAHLLPALSFYGLRSAPTDFFMGSSI